MKKPIKGLSGPNRLPLLFIAIFAIGGAAALVFTHAASNSVSMEAEAGLITSPASVISNANASGGSAVKLSQQSGIGNCGLAGAAFCEDFEGGLVAAANRLRSGDIDSNKISAGRMAGTQYDIDQSTVGWVRPADIPACRPGSVTNPLPPDDSLICNPTASINSHYSLTAAAVQNYGDNYYRINQPFDIAGRTGKISMNATIFRTDGLYGSTEIAITDEPLAVPSIIAENGNGASPRNGIIMQFNFMCRGDEGTVPTSAPTVRLYTDYDEIPLDDAQGRTDWCEPGMGIKAAKERLNHLEIRLSQNKLEVWASDYSSDGVTFGALKNMYTSPAINLGFTRGWVLFGAHNHATEKYGSFASWNAMFDNVAFDGPVLPAPQNYQAPDKSLPIGGGMMLGYGFGNLTDPIQAPITFKNVQTSGITAAKLSFNIYMEHYFNPGFATRKVDYRLNGGIWHPYTMPPTMASKYEARGANRFNYIIDISPAELKSGDNTVQFAGENLSNGYTPFVANVDLLAWH